jgi:hypothetical protein
VVPCTDLETLTASTSMSDSIGGSHFLWVLFWGPLTLRRLRSPLA